MPMRAALVLAILVPLVGQTQVNETPGRVTYEGFAQVLSATPIVQQVETRVPVRQCRRIDTYGAGSRSRARPVQRCSVFHRNRVSDRIVAYRVKLSYNGEVFFRTTQQPPGEKMRIAISVAPAPDHIALEKSQPEAAEAVAVQPAFR